MEEQPLEYNDIEFSDDENRCCSSDSGTLTSSIDRNSGISIDLSV